MASYTTNYQLHQWVPGDNFLRTDFNDDFLIIDNAVKAVADAASGAATAAAAKVELVTGSYTGNGATYTVNLGFRPKTLWIHGGIYDTTLPQSGSHTMVSLTASGFTVTYNSSDGSYNPNGNGTRYSYAAAR